MKSPCYFPVLIVYSENRTAEISHAELMYKPGTTEKMHPVLLYRSQSLLSTLSNAALFTELIVIFKP